MRRAERARAGRRTRGAGNGPGEETCVYCGAHATDWDHLRPLVCGKRPTGYCNDVRNLVPACGPCNQSKSGQDWEQWISGTSTGSPKSRGVANLGGRIEVLRQFEDWSSHAALDMRSLAGEAVWDAYWGRLEAIELQMHEAQREAVIIRELIADALQAESST
ncbi:MAG TPA: HNH endonuclease [Allosphingosinicella sp.]